MLFFLFPYSHHFVPLLAQYLPYHFQQYALGETIYCSKTVHRMTSHSFPLAKVRAANDKVLTLPSLRP